MPRSRYRILDPTRPYFLTLTVNHWLPLFTRPETVGILLDSWCFLRRETGFRLHGYVVLENHVHLVAGAPDLGRSEDLFHPVYRRRSCQSDTVGNYRSKFRIPGYQDIFALQRGRGSV